MEFMSRQIGKTEEADIYKEMASKVNKSIREKLYDKETGCIKSAVDDDRIDTTASIYAGLYLLTPTEAEKMQQTFKEKVLTPSGFLMNHDRPYPSTQKQLPHKLIGHTGYHDKYAWPWVMCQNIQVKIRIALQHPDESVKEKYKKEAIEDLVVAAENFKENKGAYEILNPDTGKPASSRTYKPPKDFMASWASYLGAHNQAVKLGWIKGK
jgi:GH15 family glucan-1,4-alpha-glucosidase